MPGAAAVPVPARAQQGWAVAARSPPRFAQAPSAAPLQRALSRTHRLGVCGAVSSVLGTPCRVPCAGPAPRLGQSRWAGEQLMLGAAWHSRDAGEVSRVLYIDTLDQCCSQPLYPTVCRARLCTMKVLILYFAYMLIKKQRPLHLL